MKNFEALDAKSFKEAIDTGTCILLDLRTDEEVSQFGEIEKTNKRFDVYKDDFSEKILALPKSKKYLLYCWHGSRSAVVRDWMKDKGFVWVKDLAGGINRWTF